MKVRNILMYVLTAIMLVLGGYLFFSLGSVGASNGEAQTDSLTDLQTYTVKPVETALSQSVLSTLSYDKLGIEIVANPEGAYIYTGTAIGQAGDIAVYGSNPKGSFLRMYQASNGMQIYELTLPAVPLEVLCNDLIIMRSIDSLYTLRYNGEVLSGVAIGKHSSPIERMLIKADGSLSFMLSSGKSMTRSGTLHDGWMQADGASITVDVLSDRTRRSALLQHSFAGEVTRYTLHSDTKLAMVYNWGTIGGYVIFTVERVQDSPHLPLLTSLLVFKADDFSAGPIAEELIDFQPHFFIKNWILPTEETIDIFLAGNESVRRITILVDSIARKGYIADCLR